MQQQHHNAQQQRVLIVTFYSGEFEVKLT